MEIVLNLQLVLNIYLDTNISNKGYVIREKPKSTLFDSNYGSSEIFGVDTTKHN